MKSVRLGRETLAECECDLPLQNCGPYATFSLILPKRICGMREAHAVRLRSSFCWAQTPGSQSTREAWRFRAAPVLQHEQNRMGDADPLRARQHCQYGDT